MVLFCFREISILLCTRRSLSVGAWFFFMTCALSQKPMLPRNGDNIVPNNGFEMTTGKWDQWFYKGRDFGEVMKYWYSPTPTSPDVYNAQVHIPKDWAEKGFGRKGAFSGKSCVGLTLYGCKNGKPHCREYIAIQLAEPLVPGQDYVFSCHVAPLMKGLRTNGIQASLAITPPEEELEVIPPLEPVYFAPKVILSPLAEWIRLAGRFTATLPSEYLVIGNFYTDEQTVAESIEKNSFAYAYYYVDEVTVRKVPPFKKVPVPDDDISKLEPQPGMQFVLKNIHFDFDRFELHPRSYIELFKLRDLMKKYPAMQIQLTGHTDSIGYHSYNIDLSKKRADAAQQFLTQQGIAPGRIRTSGMGATQPVTFNMTSEGRRLNRRVEVRVLKM
jgi:outer membrane protein OmpA-like peptidoglycan-associated protein